MKKVVEIIDYLKSKCGVEFERDIAKIIALTPSDLARRKLHDKIPYKNLLQACEEHNISADELFFGRKPEDPTIKQFQNEDIARKLIDILAKLAKERPEFFRDIYRKVIGEASWLATERKKEMSQELSADDGIILRINRKKMINAIFHFASKTKNCGKTKLMKLMYHLDFFHFREAGRSVTGLSYYAWKQGPVPADLFMELSRDIKPDLREAIEIEVIKDFHKIVPKEDFNFDKSVFSKRELRLLENVTIFFKETTAEQIVEVTHLPRQPWFKTIAEKGEGKMIRYMLAVDGKHGLTRREIIERQEELREMYKNLGLDWGDVPDESDDIPSLPENFP
ncbi:MAG: Panacea domain-containing protein [Syntrophales bacterium]|nr:Panacea domain-containing protein [Syntrophales bacterium]